MERLRDLRSHDIFTVQPCSRYAVVVHPHLISGDSAMQNVTALTFVMFEVGQ